MSDVELCGLRRFIDEITAETGVRFSASRIVYEEPDAPVGEHVEDPESNPLWGPDTD